MAKKKEDQDQEQKQEHKRSWQEANASEQDIQDLYSNNEFRCL